MSSKASSSLSLPVVKHIRQNRRRANLLDHAQAMSVQISQRVTWVGVSDPVFHPQKHDVPRVHASFFREAYALEERPLLPCNSDIHGLVEITSSINPFFGPGMFQEIDPKHTEPAIHNPTNLCPPDTPARSSNTNLRASPVSTKKTSEGSAPTRDPARTRQGAETQS